MIAFGSKVAQFRNFSQAYLALLQALLGEFDLNALFKANW
jgi:hypothetical protein